MRSREANGGVLSDAALRSLQAFLGKRLRGEFFTHSFFFFTRMCLFLGLCLAMNVVERTNPRADRQTCPSVLSCINGEDGRLFGQFRFFFSHHVSSVPSTPWAFTEKNFEGN